MAPTWFFGHERIIHSTAQVAPFVNFGVLVTIITRFQGTAAVITLNRPQCYNAIDSGTISQIVVFLNEIRENNLVKKIIITSDHPKAFCVGGDIRAAYEALKNADLQHGVMFFEAEYQLVYNLSTYTKPVISLVNGLCFGGGMGLSMHNQFRVITENAILGMPETIIGFFPDVGASYRFSQFPRSFANFYGLTGYNIPLSHALKWNMADYFVPAALLQELLAALCMENGDNHHIIEQFACTASELPIFNEIFIENIFSKTLPKIFDALQNCDNPDSQKLLSDLQARSPLSLAVTAKLIEIGQYLDLKKSLKLDEILAKNFMINPDLKEGIRAQVIDKDRQPQWHYKMADINEEIVRDFFIPTYSDCEVR
jgi:enoyl-CoA hydratase